MCVDCFCIWWTLNSTSSIQTNDFKLLDKYSCSSLSGMSSQSLCKEHEWCAVFICSDMNPYGIIVYNYDFPPPYLSGVITVPPAFSYLSKSVHRTAITLIVYMLQYTFSPKSSHTLHMGQGVLLYTSVSFCSSLRSRHCQIFYSIFMC